MRSSVPVVRPAPGRDDAQSPQGASFGEDPLTTVGKDTAEPTGADAHHNSPSLRWKIGQRPSVSAVDAGGHCPADRAGSGPADGACINPQFIGLGFNAFNGEPARSKRNSTDHDGDSLLIRRSRSGQIASALSLSPEWAAAGRDGETSVSISHA